MIALNDGYFETKRKLFVVTYCMNTSKYIYKYVQMHNTYVCMQVCKYNCMYNNYTVHMNVCMCVVMHLHNNYACITTRAPTYTHKCIHAHVHSCTCAFIYIHTYISICMNVKGKNHLNVFTNNDHFA